MILPCTLTDIHEETFEFLVFSDLKSNRQALIRTRLVWGESSEVTRRELQICINGDYSAAFFPIFRDEMVIKKLAADTLTANFCYQPDRQNRCWHKTHHAPIIHTNYPKHN